MHFSGLGVNECTRSARHVQAARREHRRPAHARIAVQRSRNHTAPNGDQYRSRPRYGSSTPQMLHAYHKAYRVARRSTRRICATLADAYLVAASAATAAFSFGSSACCERRNVNKRLAAHGSRTCSARQSLTHSGICILLAA